MASRLASHASGRRSGDQFRVYVADRLVVATLAAGQVEAIGTGALSMDALARSFIRARVSYRFVETETVLVALGGLCEERAHGTQQRLLVGGSGDAQVEDLSRAR